MSEPIEEIRERLKIEYEHDIVPHNRMLADIRWLLAEVDRLKVENEQLQIENRRLLVASYRA